MRRRRLVPVVVLTIAGLFAGSPSVLAQAQPADAARAAAGPLGAEAAALVALGGVGGDTARLEQAVRPLVTDGASRSALVESLDRADAAGAGALPSLSRANPALSPDVRSALSRLSPADREAATNGRPISIQAEVYLRALDHLVRSGGSGPRTPTPPDTQAIAAALATTTGAASAPGERSGGSRLPIILAGLGAVALAVTGGAFAMRRRPARSAPTSPPPGAPAAPLVTRPSAASMHDLLDVSRRLTAAASAGNVDRLVVRHALDLIRGDGAALLRVDDGGALRPSAESHSDLLVVEELADSAIARVAETGQTLVQASASDRAIRSVPAAVAAVPLVGGGRVLAVLVVVRRVHEPFTTDERNVLEALAPVAAAAMHTATQSKAAMETGLLDALTATGNRRRFDGDLAAALAAGDGPTSLIIVDLDHFKSVNDTYGHQAGDTVLRVVGSVLKDHVRPGDDVYRFGGEEFCVLLRDTDATAAAEVAERLRDAIERATFSVSEGEVITRTASFGVATTTSSDGDDLVARADRALYDAKHGGRNAVRVDGASIS